MMNFSDAPFLLLYLIIDDYDQLSALIKNPLDELRDVMLQARDLSLHIIIAGTPADFTKSDLLIKQVRACRTGIVLGCAPADPALLGVRMSDLPPGRGYLVRGKQRTLFQVAHLAPERMLPWVKRLTQTLTSTEP